MRLSLASAYVAAIFLLTSGISGVAHAQAVSGDATHWKIMTDKDPRNIRNGLEIPREDYCDQPYIVQTDDGAWLCVMTTAHGDEGVQTQHVISVRSRDQGKSWEKLVDIEPPGPPEASYVTALKTPFGRVCAFYNHNTDNLREVKADTEYSRKRGSISGAKSL